MGVAVLGIFSNNIQGIEGGILLGISHGFVSPALFICVGGIIYSRVHTRVIKYFSGLVNRMPIFTTIFFLFTLFNTAVPLSLNYLGEFMSLTGIFFQSPLVSLLGATGIVLSAAYSIWVYARISYGSFSDYLLSPHKLALSLISNTNSIKNDKKLTLRATDINDLNRREFFILFPLLSTTLIFGFYPNIILNSINLSVSNLIYII